MTKPTAWLSLETTIRQSLCCNGDGWKLGKKGSIHLHASQQGKTLYARAKVKWMQFRLISHTPNSVKLILRDDSSAELKRGN